MYRIHITMPRCDMLSYAFNSRETAELIAAKLRMQHPNATVTVETEEN